LLDLLIETGFISLRKPIYQALAKINPNEDFLAHKTEAFHINVIMQRLPVLHAFCRLLGLTTPDFAVVKAEDYLNELVSSIETTVTMEDPR